MTQIPRIGIVGQRDRARKVGNALGGAIVHKEGDAGRPSANNVAGEALSSEDEALE